MRCTKYHLVAARSTVTMQTAPSTLLPEDGPSPRLSRSVLDSPWLSTILRTILQTRGRAERARTAEQAQGASSEGNLHFPVVSSSAISGLIQPPIPYLPPRKVLGIAQPKGRYAVRVTAMLI